MMLVVQWMFILRKEIPERNENMNKVGSEKTKQFVITRVQSENPRIHLFQPFIIKQFIKQI